MKIYVEKNARSRYDPKIHTRTLIFLNVPHAYDFIKTNHTSYLSIAGAEYIDFDYRSVGEKLISEPK